MFLLVVNHKASSHGNLHRIGPSAAPLCEISCTPYINNPQMADTISFGPLPRMILDRLSKVGLGTGRMPRQTFEACHRFSLFTLKWLLNISTAVPPLDPPTWLRSWLFFTENRSRLPQGLYCVTHLLNLRCHRSPLAPNFSIREAGPWTRRKHWSSACTRRAKVASQGRSLRGRSTLLVQLGPVNMLTRHFQHLLC